ncbi:MAG: hypothetical protein KatS3mg068_2695 [Candidatus Sericytochromatia bacterium]|nr:MAG: hypothetical protein KatS3mg068_2695 [Candidatus Sericytochromatia bacterium]GIX40801.1 MAG: hypothetical protein KatS3mg129_0534 [Leptospiraceae bacterium]
MFYRINIVNVLVFIALPIWSFSYQELRLESYKNILPIIEDGTIYTNLKKINSNLGIITVIGKIDANIDYVWKLLNSDNKQIYPDILEKHILEKKGNLYVKKSLLNFPWPLSDRWTIIKEIIDPVNYGKEWIEIGGDIKVNRGAVRLFPYKNNTTIMVFKLSFDPGLSFIPEWAIEMGMKSKAPSIIERIRYCIKYCNIK